MLYLPAKREVAELWKSLFPAAAAAAAAVLCWAFLLKKLSDECAEEDDNLLMPDLVMEAVN